MLSAKIKKPNIQGLLRYRFSTHVLTPLTKRRRGFGEVDLTDIPSAVNIAGGASVQFFANTNVPAVCLNSSDYRDEVVLKSPKD